MGWEPPLAVLRDRAWQNLYRDFAVELYVLRAVHFTHSAGAERRENFVGSEQLACRKQHLNDQVSVSDSSLIVNG